MVLNPIRIFEGTFGGPTLFLNDTYISPNEHRASLRRGGAVTYKQKLIDKDDLVFRKSKINVPKDEVEAVFDEEELDA